MARNFAIQIHGAHQEDDDRGFNELYEGFLAALGIRGYKVVTAHADWEHQRLPDHAYAEQHAKNPTVRRSYAEGRGPDIVVQPPPAGAGGKAGGRKAK